jgi:hypothetical protein
MIWASAHSGGLDYAQEAPEPSKRQAGLTFLELLPDALRQLKVDFEAHNNRARTKHHIRAMNLELTDDEADAPSWTRQRPHASRCRQSDLG